MSIEEVRNLIKNCPRGDVGLVAQAGPKTTKLAALEKDISVKKPGSPHILDVLSQVHVNGLLSEKMPFIIDKRNENHVGDVVLGSEVHAVKVDMPTELVSSTDNEQEALIPHETNSEDGRHMTYQTASTLDILENSWDSGTNEIDDDDDDDNDVNDIDIADLPPSIPPPPIPEEIQTSTVESSFSSSDQLLQVTIPDASLHPLALFEDTTTEQDEGPILNHSDSFPTQAFDKTPQIDDIPPGQQEKHFFSDSGSSGYDQEQVVVEGEEINLPLKPPSLFGNETERSPASSLSHTLEENESALFMNESIWNAMDTQPQDTLLRPPSLFGDDLDSLPSASLPKSMEYVVEERSTVLNETSWSSMDDLPIKPPSLFDDEHDRLMCLLSTLTPPEQDICYTQEHSSPVFEFVNSSGIVGAPSLDVPDDDMASLPPAPPPPSSRVNRSSSWSISSSNKNVPSAQRTGEMSNLNIPLPSADNTEQKSSKKRILPLRIRSKRGRKSSEQSEVHNRAEVSYPSPFGGFDGPSSSSNELSSQPLRVTHSESPEDDMESLPPAPPPPRLSPATRSPLPLSSENSAMDDPQRIQEIGRRFHSGYKQPGETARLTPPQGREHDVKLVHPSHQPVKKETSFRKITARAEKYKLISLDSTLRAPNNVEHEVNADESFDPMSPPPLPPKMELWSERGSAEAELALLDQILTLEDSSKSGSEQSSEDGSSSVGMLATSTPEPVLLDDNSGESRTRASSQQGIGGLQDSGQVSASPSLNSHQSSPDVQKPPESNIYSRTLPASPSLEDKPSDGTGEVKNVVKQRRPAPPIPVRPQGNVKAATLPNKLGLTRLVPGITSATSVQPTKAATLSNQPKATLGPGFLHHKEDQTVLSASKGSSIKKRNTKAKKGKRKHVDSKHVDTQGIPHENSLESKSERSRSWTRRLFGFRSRSKSNDKSSVKKDRSRSVSPARGILFKSRRPVIPSPLLSHLKPPMVQREIVDKVSESQKGATKDYREEASKPQASEPSHVVVAEQPKDEVHRNVQNGNEVASTSVDYESAKSSFDSSSVEEYDGDESTQASVDVPITLQQKPSEAPTGQDSLIPNNQEGSVTIDEKEQPDLASETDLPVLNACNGPAPPPKPARAFLTMQDVDLTPKTAKVPVKPPVPKKPQFLEAVSTSGSPPGQNVEEFKFKHLEKDISCDSAGSQKTEDSIVCEIPKFKPPPLPPLILESDVHINDNDTEHATDSPTSPGPPNFKPPPPPGITTQKPSETFSIISEASPGQGAGSGMVRKKMKPLPPIPTDFTPISKDKDKQEEEEEEEESSAFVRGQGPLLLRQYAQELDEPEEQSFDIPVGSESGEQLLEELPALDKTTETCHQTQVVDIENAVILQSLVEPVNASGSEDIDDSEWSSEWEESSSQGNAGLTLTVSKLVKSASFSVGDHLIKPAACVDDLLKPDIGIMRPPPPMRRRSSSLPGFPVEGDQKEEGTVASYWRTGNLQELINSRNQEADIDEGVIEVQVR